MALKLLLCIALIQSSKPDISMSMISDEYHKNVDLISRLSRLNILYHDTLLQNGKEYSTHYMSFGEYTIYRWLYLNNAKNGGEFITPQHYLSLGVNREKDQHYVYKYMKITNSQHAILLNRYCPNTLSILYAIPGYDVTVSQLLRGDLSARIPGKAIAAKRIQLDGEEFVRLYFTLSAAATDFKYEDVIANGYVDLSPKRNWVVAAGSLNGNHHWKVVYEGLVNSVPRLMGVSHKYIIDKEKNIIRTDDVIVHKHEAITSPLERSAFSPGHYGFNISYDDDGDTGKPPYLLFSILTGLLLIIAGAFCLRKASTSNKRESTS